MTCLIKFLDGTERVFKTLQGADLRCANLQGADLRSANLWSADLRSANLKGADLRRANLWRANLRGANLQDANLQDANLQDAKLQDANLWRANLWSATGNGREIKTIQADRYVVNITSDRIQIGCRNYSRAEWFAFNDDEIDEMDEYALKWWRIWKPILQQILEDAK